jgi:hypothetical protein
MAANPVPLIVPCHRVLAAGGKIGGFSAPGGSDTKMKMLELEGAVPTALATQATFGFAHGASRAPKVTCSLSRAHWDSRKAANPSADGSRAW